MQTQITPASKSIITLAEAYMRLGAIAAQTTKTLQRLTELQQSLNEAAS